MALLYPTSRPRCYAPRKFDVLTDQAGIVLATVMQLSFEAETTEQALAEEPSEVIVFQHAGGERAEWTDSKLQKEGNHPIVYPAAGSHATFYDSAVYIQNGHGTAGLSPPWRSTVVQP